MAYKNPEDRKLYYQKNKEYLKQKARENHLDNRERNLAHMKERYKNKKHSYQEYKKIYYLEHKESILEYARIYRLENGEEINRKIAEYSKSPQGKINLYRKSIKRRQHKLGVSIKGSHTSDEWLKKVSQYEAKCHACGILCTLDRVVTKTTLTKDHIIPISKGGSDSIENIVPMCLSCNAAKGNRL